MPLACIDFGCFLSHSLLCHNNVTSHVRFLLAFDWAASPVRLLSSWWHEIWNHQQVHSSFITFLLPGILLQWCKRNSNLGEGRLERSGTSCEPQQQVTVTPREGRAETRYCVLRDPGWQQKPWQGPTAKWDCKHTERMQSDQSIALGVTALPQAHRGGGRKLQSFSETSVLQGFINAFSYTDNPTIQKASELGFSIIIYISHSQNTDPEPRWRQKFLDFYFYTIP